MTQVVVEAPSLSGFGGPEMRGRSQSRDVRFRVEGLLRRDDSFWFKGFGVRTRI